MGQIAFSFDGSSAPGPEYRFYVGNLTAVPGVVTFSSSYATGGDSYTPQQFGLSSVVAFLNGGITHDFCPFPDIANKKIKLMTHVHTETAATTNEPTVAQAANEVDAATNVSAVQWRVVVLGEP